MQESVCLLIRLRYIHINEGLVHQLYRNCKLHPDFIIDKIQQQDNFLYGYNILKDEFSNNMIKEGIVDSFSTIRTAIEDAISVGGILMTTECLIYKEIDYTRKNLINQLLLLSFSRTDLREILH